MLQLEGNVNVVWRDRPFNGRVFRSALPQGMTCAEIVASVPNLDTRRFLEVGTVCVNGHPVPRPLWAQIKPKSRADIIVTLHMPLLGGGAGGGGAKDALRIVAAIALVAIATAISGGALGPQGLGLLGEAFAAGTIGAQVLAGAVTLGGALLLGAFVKPPAAAIEDKSQSDEGAPAALQGNALKRGGSIPRVIGTHRAFPPFFSQPLVDLDEYDEVIEGVYGFAGPHRLRFLKFGDIFADDIDPNQLEYQFYELTPDDDGVDENVQLMLYFRGTQDSVSFFDSSFYERALTASGADVFIDKDARFLGFAAAYFSNANAHISIQSVPAFAQGDLSWSIDTWLQWDGAASASGYLAGHCDATATAAGSAWLIEKKVDGKIGLTVFDGTGPTTLESNLSVGNELHHAAVSRIGNVLYLWLDGILQDSVAFTGDIPLCAGTLDIGARGSGFATNRWRGWINNFRFTVGSSWYEAGENFTPPQTQYKPAQPTLVTRYGKTASPGITLSEHRIANEQPTQATRDVLSNAVVPARSTPKSQSVVARGRGFDEVWMTLGFTGGLFYSDDDFDRNWFNGMPFRIRVREFGAGSDEWFNLPEIHIHDRRSAPFSRLVVFRWDSDAELTNGLPATSPPARKGWRAAYSTVPVQDQAPTGIGGWQADAHFYAGSGDTYFAGGFATGEGSGTDENNLATTGLRNIRLTTERAEFFLDGLVTKGPIEIEITRGQLYIADEFTYPTYSLNTDPPVDALGNGVFDFFGWALLAGSPVLILKQSNASDNIQISRLSTVWNQPPVAREGEFATIYVKVKGRNLDALSALASGLVADWDGSAWTGLNVTSNPAPHYRDVLVGQLNDNRIPETLVNDTVLLEWRTRCNDIGFECNAVFNGEQVDRVLDVIASCGYARPRQSENWDVAQDRDFSSIAPVQMFTPRNTRGFRWEKAFVRHRPDGLRVRYNDALDNYVERTLVVPRLDILDAHPGRLEEIRYDGLVNETDVVLKALYDQQQVIDRFTFYHGEVDVESLVCQRGDLVLVQHDTLDQFAGYSRVLSFEVVDGAITSIRLDGTVSPVDAFFEVPTLFFEVPTDFFSDNVGVAIRLKNGAIISFEAAVSADGFTLTPVQPLVGFDSGDFERECLVATGRLLRANRRMLVYNIQPRANLTAEVTFVDEAPQLWQFPEPLQVEEAFMRNLIVNGDMRLNKRNDKFTTSSNVIQYTLDRWYRYGDPGVFTVEQSDDQFPAGFMFSLKVEVGTPSPSAYGEHFVGYTFDGVELAGLDWPASTGKQVALTFNVRSSVAGTFYGAFQVNGGDDQSYVFSYTIPTVNTWYRRVVTVPPPTPTSIDRLRVRFSLGGADNSTTELNAWVGSDDLHRGPDDTGIMGTAGATWNLAGVQFEVAPATQFEHLLIGVGDALAARYYQSPPGPQIGTGFAVSTTVAIVVVPVTAPLRNEPLLDFSALADFALVHAGGSITPTALDIMDHTGELLSGVWVQVTVAGGLTAGQGVRLTMPGSGYIDFESEYET